MTSALPSPRRWLVRGRDLRFEKPEALGIVNLTPDSFYAPSRCASPEAALALGREHRESGALGLDLGAESTRPGARRLTAEEELARLRPLLAPFVREFSGLVLSIDTRHALVARAALEAGFQVVNDVSSLSDPAMAETVAEYGAGLVLTHAPLELASGPARNYSLAEIADFLLARSEAAARGGVALAGLAWDPGLGFGKTPENCRQIVSRFAELAAGCRFPLMCAASHKRFTRPDPAAPEGADNSGAEGTRRAHAAAAAAGIPLYRVHDCRDVADLAFAEGCHA